VESTLWKKNEEEKMLRQKYNNCDVENAKKIE